MNDLAVIEPPNPIVVTPEEDAPLRVLDQAGLAALGAQLDRNFKQYVSDRQLAELKWLQNLRQYLGVYDPEIEKQIPEGRSRAYPRITRVKCISVLARIMNLMFPGNERNWSLEASPNAEMKQEDVMAAVQAAMQKAQASGMMGHNGGPPIDDEFVRDAVQTLANDRAKAISSLIDDQFQELGGDQTLDYIALNRKALASGIIYGLGLLEGPFVREVKQSGWHWDPMTRRAVPVTRTIYKPQYEFLPIWDFYPDMSAKTLAGMDGYYKRVVMSRGQLRKLANRTDFFKDNIRKYIRDYPNGNFKAQNYETELRSMGVKNHVNEEKADSGKYEIIVWKGPVSGEQLRCAGIEIEKDKVADDFDAEVWMVGGNVIKAEINPWRQMGVDVRTLHWFQFDEDDTSVVGNGLPNVMRDSQMSICAAARMLMDNGSITCGPNIEVNTELLLPHTDKRTVYAYKVWEREGTGVDAQFPAVRNVQIDSHMPELLKIIELFMGFADAETFVGPQTGGDMAKGPSEPMRTAAGASMLRSDAALPFKDIIRNFDTFTQSVVYALVHFNRKFNPELAPEGDYNVVARGATSLIAKEIRAMQMDSLAQTLAPEDWDDVDRRAFNEARFKVRDLENMMLTPEEAKQNKAARGQFASAMQDQQLELAKAEVRKTLTDGLKNIAQAQKNVAGADKTQIDAAMALLEQAMRKDEEAKPRKAG